MQIRQNIFKAWKSSNSLNYYWWWKMALSFCKKLSLLLRRITSKNVGDFYCLNCFHSHCTKEKLKEHENVCKNQDYCYVEMPKEDNKILKYNHGEKSMKVPFIIYDYYLCWVFAWNNKHRHDNPEKSWTTKKNKHAPFGYSLFTHCSFDTTKYKFDYFRGKNCMKNVYLNLREYVAKIINYEKKKKKKKWYN